MTSIMTLPDSLRLEAASPLELWKLEGAWRVTVGYVDLFAVRLHAGRADGRRHFLLRLVAGDVAMPFPPGGSGDAEIGLVAVGGLAAAVQPVARPEAADVAAWLGAITAAVHAGPAGARATALREGRSTIPAGAEGIGGADHPLWCRVLAGRLAAGGAGGPATGAADTPCLVTPALPVQVLETCELEVVTTQVLWASGEGEAALAQAHILIAAKVAEHVARHRARQDALADRRHALSREALHSGLSDLARAVAPLHGRLSEPAAAANGRDPLLAVAQRVAAAVGLDARWPSGEEPGAAHGRSLDRLLADADLRSRQVLLRDDWWRQENGPLIGWTREDRAPVAILPERGGYVCWNPATGEKVRVGEAQAEALSADAVMLYPGFPNRAIRLADFFGLGLRGGGGDLRLFGLLALGAALLALMLPVATGVLVDTIIPAADRGQLAVVVGGLLAVAGCVSSFELVKGLALLRVEGRMDAALQGAFFDRLLRLPAPFFKDYTAGDLADRVLGIQAMRQMLAGSTVAGLLGGVFSSVSLGLLFVYDVKLAVVAVGLTALSVMVTAFLTWRQLRQERHQAERRGRVEGMVLQLIRGVSKLKVSGAQDRAIGAWARRYADQQKTFVAAQTVVAWQTVFQALFPPLASVAMFVVIASAFKAAAEADASSAAAAGEVIGTGAFLAFQAAFGQFLGSSTQMVRSLTACVGVLPLYERARPIMAAAPENAAERTAPGRLAGAVELAGVSFSYTADGPSVLSDLSFSIAPGEFVALVGPSGSGKSTIMRLLLGLETPTRGEMFFDGQPISRLDLSALRQQVAVVMQTGRILPGSVLTNILGSEDGELADAWEAARQVGLDDDIRAMPMGMHTVVMEGGGTLSGGQRQRLMIARSLVRKPRILLLDEATSALDNRTQAIVTETLQSLSVTRLVIAHRLSTIEAVDRVLVLDRGNLVQCGRFDELMQQPGLFAELGRRQSL